MTEKTKLPYVAQVQNFIEELKGFSDTAEKTLNQIELNILDNRHLFAVFAEEMLTIRGTSMQLGLPEIASLAELGEEISRKAVLADKRPVLRKCVGALWDAQSTIKYLLEHSAEETSEERQILIHRLQATLKSLGGARAIVDSSEIEALLKSRE